MHHLKRANFSGSNVVALCKTGCNSHWPTI